LGATAGQYTATATASTASGQARQTALASNIQLHLRVDYEVKLASRLIILITAVSIAA
jgi:hypothetical protein